MILLKNLEYSENRELDFEITEFVNKNIVEIIDFFDDSVMKEYLDEEERIENFKLIMPSRCFFMKDSLPEELWETFRNIFDSSIVRFGETDIEPIYKYMLFKLLRWANILEEDGACEFCKDISDELKNRIFNCPEYANEEVDEDYSVANMIIENITTVDDYLEFLFDDWDFLEDSIDAFVTSYLNDREKFYEIFPDVELDDYTLLMSKDLYDKYIEVRKVEKSEKLSNQITINGDNNVLNNNFNNTENKINSSERKNWFEKYGVSTIVAAILGLIGVILSIIFN